MQEAKDGGRRSRRRRSPIPRRRYAGGLAPKAAESRDALRELRALVKAENVQAFKKAADCPDEECNPPKHLKVGRAREF